MTRRGWTATLAALVLAGPAMAETGTFDLRLGPVPAGTLAYSAEERGGRYAASGAVRSGGLAGLFVDAAIDATARGRSEGNDYRPDSFSSTTSEDGDTETLTFRYANGVPQVSRDPAPSKPPKHAAPPEAQGGTVDPMTAAFAILRDRPADQACDLRIEMYDGRRRTDLRLVGGTATGDGGLSCRGEYRRVAGFSQKELAEKPVWPFSVTYAPAGAALRVTELAIPTSFGTLRMVRR
ncbi:DUF3108 domain-containing protein [Mangrovicoccus algicola]|uniref:DUF3108 domain-containing protein n=1 Tax=Mangrovicoccus algicola TaxID=2771008 RepID=A0A8J7CUS8_9RHOB|nr:DUF3108 domain-containing protein [Mangrovicoccus algicola]MBE3637889.1 DUF3108 domain-containing protein [Mangrovicoccus algicola]